MHPGSTGQKVALGLGTGGWGGVGGWACASQPRLPPPASPLCWGTSCSRCCPCLLGPHSPTAEAASSKVPNIHSTAPLALIHRPGAASEGALILLQQLPYWSPWSPLCPPKGLFSTGQTGPCRGQIASLFCSTPPMALTLTQVPARAHVGPRDLAL